MGHTAYWETGDCSECKLWCWSQSIKRNQLFFPPSWKPTIKIWMTGCLQMTQQFLRAKKLVQVYFCAFETTTKSFLLVVFHWNRSLIRVTPFSWFCRCVWSLSQTFPPLPSSPSLFCHSPCPKQHSFPLSASSPLSYVLSLPFSSSLSASSWGQTGHFGCTHPEPGNRKKLEQAI